MRISHRGQPCIAVKCRSFGEGGGPLFPCFVHRSSPIKRYYSSLWTRWPAVCDPTPRGSRTFAITISCSIFPRNLSCRTTNALSGYFCGEVTSRLVSADQQRLFSRPLSRPMGHKYRGKIGRQECGAQQGERVRRRACCVRTQRGHDSACGAHPPTLGRLADLRGREGGEGPIMLGPLRRVACFDTRSLLGNHKVLYQF